jgi:hypothetical protein
VVSSVTGIHFLQHCADPVRHAGLAAVHALCGDRLRPADSKGFQRFLVIVERGDPRSKLRQVVGHLAERLEDYRLLEEVKRAPINRCQCS